MLFLVDFLVCYVVSIKEIYRIFVGLFYFEDMYNFLFFKEFVIINLIWYWFIFMCLGSIFINLVKGFNNCLVMEILKE